MHTHPPNERVKVEVEEKARTDPIVKDSQWVRERAGLEREKPKDVNEVILMDHDGLLYEGMASNFLAIRSKANGDPVVMCAPLDHILLGTILKIVIRICEKHNIEMDWSFPTLQDAKDGKWEDCCVTSKFFFFYQTV
jgi:hypothetical protein